jgi:hypothetical protein
MTTMTTIPSEITTMLAVRARRAALIEVLSDRPEMTLEQLVDLLDSRPYGDELSRLTVGEMGGEANSVLRPGESVESAVLRVFESGPNRAFASSFFRRRLGLERWVVQKLLGELAERGLLVRSGTTSSTRYKLATSVQNEGPEQHQHEHHHPIHGGAHRATRVAEPLPEDRRGQDRAVDDPDPSVAGVRFLVHEQRALRGDRDRDENHPRR